MNIGKADIVAKIRTAIDDIAPSVADSFAADVDKELWQAVKHAATELSAELPINLLDANVESLQGTVDDARGFAYGKLPAGYLRFVSIDITGTSGILCELIEPGSDAEKMQRSPWSRGSSTKPKAMLDHDENGKKVIVWWPGDSEHNSAQLTYVKAPKEENNAIYCAIREEAEHLIIYRAASIFFEGKKEGAIADRFRNL